MLARIGVGLQAAWDRTPQHDVQLLIITRLRGNSSNVFFGSDHTKSHIAQLIRRRIFSIFHFSFLFIELPLACDSSHEYSLLAVDLFDVRGGCGECLACVLVLTHERNLIVKTVLITFLAPQNPALVYV